MATERKPHPFEAKWAEGRKATQDFLRAAEGGVEHTARKERWSNERTDKAYGKLIQAARALTTVNKDGNRKALDEDERLSGLAEAVYQRDDELAAAKAAKLGRKPAEPMPAEVAEQAQADDPPHNPPARRKALSLLNQAEARH